MNMSLPASILLLVPVFFFRHTASSLQTSAVEMLVAGFECSAPCYSREM